MRIADIAKNQGNTRQRMKRLEIQNMDAEGLREIIKDAISPEQIREIIREELAAFLLAQSAPKEEEFICARDVAQMLNMSVASVHRLKDKNGLPWHPIGGAVRFLESEVRQWAGEGS